MPGSWEIKSNPRLQFGLLHTWSLHPDFLLAMTRLQKPTGYVSYDYQHDKPYDMARNTIAKNALDDGAEWVFFLDTDVIPPPDAIERLMAHNLPIVGGLYYRRHPETFPEVFRLANENQYEAFRPSELLGTHFEVDGIGAGCLLVHRRVFESLIPEVKKLKMGTHPNSLELFEFFKWSIFEPPYASEDLYFCNIAKKKGWRIFCDASISCGHVLSTMMIKDGRTAWTPLEGSPS